MSVGTTIVSRSKTSIPRAQVRRRGKWREKYETLASSFASVMKSLKSLNLVSSGSPNIKYTGNHTQAPKTQVIKRSKIRNHTAVNSEPQTRENLPLCRMKEHVPAACSPGSAERTTDPGSHGRSGHGLDRPAGLGKAQRHTQPC